MCRIERLSQLGEPSRTVCGGNLSWYAAHPVPLSHEIMTYREVNGGSIFSCPFWSRNRLTFLQKCALLPTCSVPLIR